jgi:cell filamentation protein
MSEPLKISIRFFNDREVRAVWDVVAVHNEEDDYQRVRNYWKHLKVKLKRENNQLVSVTTRLKFVDLDGDKRLLDDLDSEGVIALDMALVRC